MFFEVEGLTKRFGGLTAVADVSFAIAEGEIVGVFGPNGSGKTTLLNLIAGIYPPSAGQLVFKDRVLSGAKPHELAALGIVKTFQNPQLFAELSVAEHVLIAAHLKLKRALGAGRIATLLNRHLRGEALATEVERVLALCRLGVAMALMCEPELLLLDEPATGLGEDEIKNLGEVLRALRAHGTTLCIIDHKVGFLGALADRAIAMHHGSKIAEGPPAEVLENPDVVAAYLGRGHA